MKTIFLILSFVFLSLQTAQNCTPKNQVNVLAVKGYSKKCENMDKCSLHCSKIVPGCKEKRVLGVEFKNSNAGRTYSFVCRNEEYKPQKNTIKHYIDRKLNKYFRPFGYKTFDMGQNKLDWMIPKDMAEDQLNFHNSHQLKHPITTLWFYGTLLRFFGQLCKENQTKKKIEKTLTRFLKGEKVFKGRESIRNAVKKVREIYRRKLLHAEQSEVIHPGKKDIIYIEKKTKEFREWFVNRVIEGGYDLCPCHLLTDWAKDFNDKSEETYQNRKKYFYSEGWQDSRECIEYYKSLKHIAELSREICQDACRKKALPVSTILNVKRFSGCYMNYDNEECRRDKSKCRK